MFKIFKKKVDAGLPLCEIVATHGKQNNNTQTLHMKKTLLIAAAALAAGIISTQASSVYSQNIVGYVNTTLQPGFNLIANPVNTGVSNGVNEIFPNVADGDIFVFWNGGGYDQVEYSPVGASIFGLPTPWFDPNNPTVSVAIPTVQPGVGFYYYNSGSVNTNTVSGNVITASTNGLTSGFNLVSSIVPIGGSVTNANWNLNPNDGDIYVTWNGGGYDQVEYSPVGASIFGLPTPWFDPNNPTVSVNPPAFNVSQGFFYYNSASTNIWTQAITNN